MDLERIFNEITRAISCLGNPNWIDYVQIISSIISIIISAFAVIMAIRVPKEISNRQDQISLFDKRFAAYDIFLRYDAFTTGIDELEGIEIYRECFMDMFFLEERTEFEFQKALFKLVQLSTPLQHMPFLFENITDSEMDMLFSSMFGFVSAISNNSNVEECKERLVNNIKEFKEKHLESIVGTLKIK